MLNFLGVPIFLMLGSIQKLKNYLTKNSIDNDFSGFFCSVIVSLLLFVLFIYHPLVPKLIFLRLLPLVLQ